MANDLKLNPLLLILPGPRATMTLSSASTMRALMLICHVPYLAQTGLVTYAP